MLERLLVTGAAGRIGHRLRPLLADLAGEVVLSDIAGIGRLDAHETFEICDLADAAAVDRLLEGIDGIIHLGGISSEQCFDALLHSNIVGTYNLFEAARRRGRPRIVFASTGHVTGFYRRDERLDATVAPKPDSLYGVSKAFGEALASLYWHKFGQECLSVRIGSCFPRPGSPEELVIWLAVEDFADLCARAFAVPRLGHAVVYGVSDNRTTWWDNSHAAFLGWRPRYSSGKWHEEVLAASAPANPDDPAILYQGAAFVAAGHPADES